MRSRLTTFVTAGFLLLGSGGAMALNGGASLGLGGHASQSASFAQYRPVETPAPVTTPPATGPPASTPPVPAPPASKFIPSAAATVTAHGVATIRCLAACHIVLRASHGSHRVHLTVTLHANGTATVHLSKRELRKLGRGTILVSIYVDGKVVATRKVKVT
ncbi:MAG TPA: hypothetical protein VMU55_01070 [Solirubrobacteraceae bacterium]|nr:hypothetical protein [Solirubrobacteraceae bacterium]